MSKSLSYSAISLFAECPERFRRERLTDYRRVRGHDPDSARGVIIHRFMENLVNGYLEGGREWPTEKWATDHMFELWSDGFKDEQVHVIHDVSWTQHGLERSAEASMELVPVIYSDLLHEYEPVSAEREIEMPLPVPGKIYTKLRGKVDMISKPNLIVDYKTAKSQTNDRWMDYDLQATIYSALVGHEKSLINFVRFIFLKKAKPRIQVVSTKRDARHTHWLLTNLIPQVIKTIESEAFAPTPGWWCDRCPVPCGARPDIAVEL